MYGYYLHLHIALFQKKVEDIKFFFLFEILPNSISSSSLTGEFNVHFFLEKPVLIWTNKKKK